MKLVGKLKAAITKEDLRELNEIMASGADKEYVLTLYVTGTTSKSVRAITNLKRICEENLKGKYSLKVVDIYQQPEQAKEGHVIAAPTLVKTMPLPLRRMIGDMGDTDRVLLGLDLQPKE